MDELIFWQNVNLFFNIDVAFKPDNTHLTEDNISYPIVNQFLSLNKEYNQALRECLNIFTKKAFSLKEGLNNFLFGEDRASFSKISQKEQNRLCFSLKNPFFNKELKKSSDFKVFAEAAKIKEFMKNGLFSKINLSPQVLKQLFFSKNTLFRLLDNFAQKMQSTESKLNTQKSLPKYLEVLKEMPKEAVKDILKIVFLKNINFIIRSYINSSVVVPYLQNEKEASRKIRKKKKKPSDNENYQEEELSYNLDDED